MILVRHHLSHAELAERTGRLGRPPPAGGVLLTGLTSAQATALGGTDDFAIVDSLTNVPAELRAVLNTPTPGPIELAGRWWAFDGRPWILGIVNVTPDSFSDGGKANTTDAALRHALDLIEEGADWLDIGGESTRPGATPVSVDDECARVIPVIEALRRKAPTVPLSIDTSKAAVARLALEAGASLVNDVTALSDPLMAGVVAKANASACLMHMQGTPRTMQVDPRYDDVVHEVAESLSRSIARAVDAGVDRARLFIDPGIGFGKTVEHNVTLLRHLDAFRVLGVPVLLGTSRKSFLGTLTGEKDASKRVVSSAVTVAVASVREQADVFRVHDVKATREALSIAQALGRRAAGL
jgi:dihydropteroate synthase